MKISKRAVLVFLWVLGAAFFSSVPVSQATDPNAICMMHKCPMMKKGQKCPMMILAEKGEKVKCPVCGEMITDGGPRKIIFYRHPMRPEVTSPSPSKDEMGMDYIPVYNDEVEQAGTPQEGQALPAGYASVLGFNLRQLMRHQSEKMRKTA